MKIFSLILAFVLMYALLLAPIEAQAQNNSSQAVKAARKHRAQQARKRQAAPVYRANAGLKRCMDQAGFNPVARDRCMRQHCSGHWGQGDCPSGVDFMTTEGASSGTPLGRCLQAAGRNPFKRDACGWHLCGGRSDKSAECAALYPPRRDPLLSN
jgi:hypothetical protein